MAATGERGWSRSRTRPPAGLAHRSAAWGPKTASSSTSAFLGGALSDAYPPILRREGSSGARLVLLQGEQALVRHHHVAGEPERGRPSAREARVPPPAGRAPADRGVDLPLFVRLVSLPFLHRLARERLQAQDLDLGRAAHASG